MVVSDKFHEGMSEFWVRVEDRVEEVGWVWGMWDCDGGSRAWGGGRVSSGGV